MFVCKKREIGIRESKKEEEEREERETVPVRKCALSSPATSEIVSGEAKPPRTVEVEIERRKELFFKEVE